MKVSQRIANACCELWTALFGWIPTPVGVLLRALFFKPLFRRMGSARLSTGILYAGTGNISLADGVRVGKNCVLTAQDGVLELGERAALSPGVHVSADGGEIRMGARVAVGPGTVLRAANHRFDRTDVPIMDQGHVPGVIVIGDDVWIGANCTVTPDVTIGRGAVIGAGAVVTHDIPAMSVAVGVPAKVIAVRGVQAEACSANER